MNLNYDHIYGIKTFMSRLQRGLYKRLTQIGQVRGLLDNKAANVIQFNKFTRKANGKCFPLVWG